MREPIVCPACGARMRHDRKRCLRCGTDLPARARVHVSPADKPSWLTRHWDVVVASTGGLVLLVVAIGLLGREEPSRPAIVQPARRSVAPASRDTGSSRARATAAVPAGAPLPDPQLLGAVAYHEGDYQAAYDRYRQAVERNPNDAESLSNAAQALVRLGRGAEAVPLFERAIALNNRRWAYHFNLAHACGLLDQWDRAVSEYRAALDLFPDDHATEYNLGMALHKRGDEAAAVDHFRRAIQLAPDEADFYLSLGISSERLGRTADALDGYRRYLELAPGSPDAGKVRARVETLSAAQPAAAAPVPDKEPVGSGFSPI